MIVEFAVENFRSFRDLQVLSMEATYEKDADNPDFNQVYTDGPARILKTKAIYGANASGKSNMIMAMAAFWQIIATNLKSEDTLSNYISPYRLTEECLRKPTYFQIIFYRDGLRYRYGFEADSKKVHSEWLYVKDKKEVLYFDREFNGIKDFNKHSLKQLKKIFDENGKLTIDSYSLVISVLDVVGVELAKTVTSSILKKIPINANTNSPFPDWGKYAVSAFGTDELFTSWIQDYLKGADNTISQLKKQKIEGKDMMMIERKVNDSVLNMPFSLDYEEASGTRKLFSWSYYLYWILRDGGTFVVDEFDARLHPLLTRRIIEMFQSPDAHEESQLIFVSHDTNLLDEGLLRRDQVAFVEKLKDGSSQVYDLSDIKGVRANDKFEKNYLKGHYGGLPQLGDMLTSLENA